MEEGHCTSGTSKTRLELLARTQRIRKCKGYVPLSPRVLNPSTRMPANFSTHHQIRSVGLCSYNRLQNLSYTYAGYLEIACVQGEDQHATKVWGTDINVADVRKNFTQFIRGFREQEGSDEAGVPKFKEEIKYLEYLQTVRPLVTRLLHRIAPVTVFHAYYVFEPAQHRLTAIVRRARCRL